MSFFLSSDSLPLTSITNIIQTPASLSPLSHLTPFSPVSLTSTTSLLPPLSPMLKPKTSSMILTSPTSPPYYTTVDLRYSRPLISVIENLDHNPEIQHRLTNYYFYKILDKWLWNDMNDILNYFNVQGNKVSVISNMSQYKPTNVHKDTQKTTELKVKFIEEKFLTKGLVRRILHKFATETGTQWVDIPHNEYFFRQAFMKVLKKKILRAISGKGN